MRWIVVPFVASLILMAGAFAWLAASPPHWEGDLQRHVERTFS